MFNWKIMGIIWKDEGGFSLLEVMIASAIFAFIIAATFTMMAVGVDVENSSVTMGNMEDRSRMVLERIVEELYGALADSIAVSPTGDSITFQVNEGYVGGEVQESTVRTLFFQYDTVENGFGGDGVDNDADGIIDEGIIVRTVEDDFGVVVETATLTHWVAGYDYGMGQPTRGLFFEPIGDRLTVRVWLQRRDAKGRLLQSVSEINMRIRN